MLTQEDEKYVISRRSATRGSTGLGLFAFLVLVAGWGALFWFLPQYLNPMLVFDGIHDNTLQRDTVNLFAGGAVILFHVVCFLLLFIVYCCGKGLNREARLLRIIDGMKDSIVRKTGESGSWKLE